MKMGPVTQRPFTWCGGSVNKPLDNKPRMKHGLYAAQMEDTGTRENTLDISSKFEANLPVMQGQNLQHPRTLRACGVCG